MGGGGKNTNKRNRDVLIELFQEEIRSLSLRVIIKNKLENYEEWKQQDSEHAARENLSFYFFLSRISCAFVQVSVGKSFDFRVTINWKLCKC